MSRRPSGRPPGFSRGTYDCTIRTSDGVVIQEHRAFLVTLTPFFRALFSEEHGGPQEANLTGVTSTVFNTLLNFYYSSQMNLSSDNVLDILDAADMLLMDEAKETCVEFLLADVGTDNCLGMLSLTLRYNLPEFRQKLLTFCLEHFDLLWQSSDEFGELQAHLLFDLLSADELNVRREIHAMYAVQRWCTFTRTVDGPVLYSLLQCVRVGLCDQQALQEFKQRCPAMAQSLAYQAAVTNTLQRGPCACSPIPQLLLQMATLPPDSSAAASGDRPATWPSSFPASVIPFTSTGVRLDMVDYCYNCGGSNPERWLPRMPYEMLFVVGGWCEGHARSALEAYDPRANRWLVHANPEFEARAYHGVVMLQQKLYVVGGLRQRSYLRTLDCFDTERCQWVQCSPMHIPRAYVSVVALADHIYAIGGHTGAERTATVERYNPKNNQWAMVASMKRRRSDGSACAINGKLYVSGGFNGQTVLLSAEEYCPTVDMWSMVAPMPGPRCSHRIICRAGRIYVIGGYDGRRRLNTVLLNQVGSIRRWEELAPMSMARSTFAVAELEEDIIVIGGFNDKPTTSGAQPVSYENAGIEGGGSLDLLQGTGQTAEVERYSPATNSWTALVPLNEPLSAMAAAGVWSLSIAKKFSCSALAPQ